MRASPSILALLAAGLGACGGGGKPVLIDAPPPPPIDAFACSQKGMVGSATALDFSKGGGAATGAVPAMGTQELTVSAIITNSAAPTNGLIIIQINNAGVYGAGATAAGRFEKPPTPGTYPMDPDQTLGFGIDFVDGVTSNGDGTASVRAKQVAVLDTSAGAGGTVKIDSFTPLAVPGGTTTIAATITNAKFKGFNVLADGSLDQAGNGCDMTITNLQFINLSVKWQATPFPVSFAPPQPTPPDFGPKTIAGAAVVSADLSIAP